MDNVGLLEMDHRIAVGVGVGRVEHAHRLAVHVEGGRVVEDDDRQRSLGRIGAEQPRADIVMGDNLDPGRAENLVAAGVVPVEMGVDQETHRLIGDGLDLVEDRRRVGCELIIDHEDPVGTDGDANIAALPLNHVNAFGDAGNLLRAGDAG
jgi:hypothetical protein